MTSYHVPVLLDDSIAGLAIKPDGTYIDLTFGGGSHSRAILNQLSSNGRLYSFDRDIDSFANNIEDNRFKLVHGNYRYLRNYLDFYGITKVDGIIADLGISSYQIDTMSRGFSYRLGGKLDMRMNKSQSYTAADVLNKSSEDKLNYIFKTYGELSNHKTIVKIIMQQRELSNFSDIESFIKILNPVLPFQNEYKFLSLIFQALRIEVNDEFNSLVELLDVLPTILTSGSRLSVISYHSLEDRLVKNLIRTGNTKGILNKDFYGKHNLYFKAIHKGVLLASEEEIENNSRAKSAKLRIAERI